MESFGTSILSKTVDSYHRANSLYDGTINAFSTMTLSAVASNEVFTYKNAMKEEDYREFVKAMMKEITEHEEREHWTMIERRELPPGVKTIMSIWSFKRKPYVPRGEHKYTWDIVHRIGLCDMISEHAARLWMMLASYLYLSGKGGDIVSSSQRFAVT